MKSLVVFTGFILLVVALSTPSQGLWICRKSIDNSESSSSESRERCEEIEVRRSEGTPEPDLLNGTPEPDFLNIRTNVVAESEGPSPHVGSPAGFENELLKTRAQAQYNKKVLCILK